MVGPDKQELNSDWYYRLLRYHCIPEVRRINDPQNGQSLAGCSWQQDGASIHVTPPIMRLLHRAFGNRVISRNRIAGLLWPARSPDLNPLDFFLW